MDMVAFLRVFLAGILAFISSMNSAFPDSPYLSYTTRTADFTNLSKNLYLSYECYTIDKNMWNVILAILQGIGCILYIYFVLTSHRHTRSIKCQNFIAFLIEIELVLAYTNLQWLQGRSDECEVLLMDNIGILFGAIPFIIRLIYRLLQQLYTFNFAWFILCVARVQNWVENFITVFRRFLARLNNPANDAIIPFHHPGIQESRV